VVLVLLADHGVSVLVTLGHQKFQTHISNIPFAKLPQWAGYYAVYVANFHRPPPIDSSATSHTIESTCDCYQNQNQTNRHQNLIHRHNLLFIVY
jgi:hypothetical protein